MAHHYPSSSFLGFLLVLLFCLISPNFVHSHDNHDIHDDNCQVHHQSSPPTSSQPTSSSPPTSSSSRPTPSPPTSSSPRPTPSPPTSSSSQPTSSSSRSTSSPLTSISDLCQKHPNPNFCLELLKSKKDLNLTFICQFAIAESIKCASNTKGLINVLIHETKDNGMKHHYETCLKCYSDAFQNLLVAAKHMDQGDIRGVIANVLEITKSIGECKKSIPLGAESVLQKKNEEMMLITFVVKIFATSHIPIGPMHHI